MSDADFMVTLAKYMGTECVTLKAESVSPITVQRNPIIIPLPAGTIVGIELGRHNNVITVSGVANAGTAVVGPVGKPFATKLRLEYISRYWYSFGQLILTVGDVEYKGFITGLEFSMVGGLEDRYQFKLQFAEGTQHLSAGLSTITPPPVTPVDCNSAVTGNYFNYTSGTCETCDLNHDGDYDYKDHNIAILKHSSGLWSDEQYAEYSQALYDYILAHD